MSTHIFDDRPKNKKPKMQPMEFYFLGKARCPQCHYEENVMINRDKFVYHECNQGNVMAEIPSVVLPQSIIKHLHKEKLIDNLKFLEKLEESSQAYPLQLKKGICK